jgi:hypothetical protein
LRWEKIDSYFLFTVIPTYNLLQDLHIPSVLKGLPKEEHSISNIYKSIGIDGIKRMWKTLGGVNEAPNVDAGLAQEIKFDGSATTSLSGSVTDDSFQNTELTSWWSEAEASTEVSFSDSLDLNTNVSFSAEGEFILVLHADDSKFHIADSLKIIVTANPSNKAPVVNAGPDQILTLPGATIDLLPIISDDQLPLNSSLTTKWLSESVQGIFFDDDTNPNSSVSFSEPGKFALRLNVGDSELETSDSLFVTVFEENEAEPIIYISLDEGKGNTGTDLQSGTTILEMKNTSWTSDPENRSLPG